jgi:hypothetical protein
MNNQHRKDDKKLQAGTVSRIGTAYDKVHDHTDLTYWAMEFGEQKIDVAELREVWAKKLVSKNMQKHRVTLESAFKIVKKRLGIPIHSVRDKFHLALTGVRLGPNCNPQHKLACEIIQTYGDDLLAQDGFFWVHDKKEGHYKPMEREEFSFRVVTEFLDPNTENKFLSSPKPQMRTAKYCYEMASDIEPDPFSGLRGGVAAGDEYLYVQDGQLHTELLKKAHRAQVQLPSYFTPNSPCPLFQKLLEEAFPLSDPESECQRKILALQFAVVIFGLTEDYKSCFLWFGASNFWKIALQEILGSFLPEPLVCAVPKKGLKNPAYINYLAPCRINYCSEFREGEKLPTENRGYVNLCMPRVTTPSKKVLEESWPVQFKYGKPREVQSMNLHGKIIADELMGVFEFALSAFDGEGGS